MFITALDLIPGIVPVLLAPPPLSLPYTTTTVKGSSQSLLHAIARHYTLHELPHLNVITIL